MFCWSTRCTWGRSSARRCPTRIQRPRAVGVVTPATASPPPTRPQRLGSWKRKSTAVAVEVEEEEEGEEEMTDPYTARVTSTSPTTRPPAFQPHRVVSLLHSLAKKTTDVCVCTLLSSHPQVWQESSLLSICTFPVSRPPGILSSLPPPSLTPSSPPSAHILLKWMIIFIMFGKMDN